MYLLVVLATLIAVGTGASAVLRYVIPWAHRSYVNFRHNRLPLLNRLLLAGVEQEFAERAIAQGLADEDVKWNARLGRPPHWIETADPKAELQRRAEYRRTHQMK